MIQGKDKLFSINKKAVPGAAFLLIALIVFPFFALAQERYTRDSAQLHDLPTRDSTASSSRDSSGISKDVLDADTTADSTYIVNDKNEIVKIRYIPDTIFLKNGDKITGKILAFEQGRLKIDGQDPGVVNIKWHKIATIGGGNRIFKVEDHYGVMYIGRIRLSKDTGEIVVQGQKKFEIHLEDIVRIYPIEKDWYRGLKGDLGGGVTYTKSSDVLQINVDYNLYYVISKWRFVNNFSFLETTTKDEPTSTRIQFDLQALYALPQKWVLSEINSFNRNDELGIKSRISIGLGGGNSVVQTETARLLLLTGIVHNSEQNIESEKAESNFEWPFSVQQTIYSFIRPNISSSTYLSSFVGITDKGRYRFDASTDITWEFISDFKLKFTLYYNFDNKILVGKNSTEDYGTTLSFIVELK